MEKRISDLIESTINDLGFALVQVKIHGLGRKIVEVLIDHKNNRTEKKIDIADCRLVSRNVSAILDIENIMSEKYFLEVSSAGVERPLTKLEDFISFVGKDIKVRLKEPFNDKLTYKGKLLGLEEGKIKLQSKNVTLLFDYDNITKSHLMFSDEMFRSLLKKK